MDQMSRNPFVMPENSRLLLLCCMFNRVRLVYVSVDVFQIKCNVFMLSVVYLPNISLSFAHHTANNVAQTFQGWLMIMKVAEIGQQKQKWTCSWGANWLGKDDVLVFGLGWRWTSLVISTGHTGHTRMSLGERHTVVGWRVFFFLPCSGGGASTLTDGPGAIAWSSRCAWLTYLWSVHHCACLL